MGKNGIHISTSENLRNPAIYGGDITAELSIRYEETLGSGRPVEEVRAEIDRCVELAMNRLSIWRHRYKNEKSPQQANSITERTTENGKNL